ncbi:FecR family protein [Sphingomonas nostoxanthinifaciens]|uniref:FecR family protein n=1 Tax=Sphingomonas nostoxanthinifaciens TaxID=2872652 RepID=UPI001CC1E11C|nr:FecR domain-containing protein [Sphingomonas nostoxanthinifaciens]UAK25466.1 FecR domain-containing protein [Sphingomonas nostoxanthinifaciens]
MDEGGGQKEDVCAEAAQWVARLNALPVSRETLEQFYAWRRDERCRAAYDEASAAWDATDRLAADPALQALADAAYKRGGRQRLSLAPAMGRMIPAMLGATALLGSGLVYMNWHPHGVEYETRIGEQSAVALADGSKVMLDTDTQLEVRYDRSTRHIELRRGQAYFTVAHNGRRPFMVEADGTDVVATGTQFAVRRREDGVDVTLVEGRVAVTPPDARSTALASGQQLIVRAGQAPHVRKVDPATATAWRSGRMVLDGITLGEAIAEANRYAARPVILEAKQYADRRISGSFEAGDVPSFVAAAVALLPLAAHRDKDGITHLVSSKQATID